MNRKQKVMLARILASAVLLVALAFVPVTGIARLLCYLAVYLVIGYDILSKAFYGIVHGQVFDECFLMAVATVGAFALAIYDRSGDYNEAIAVMLFYQVGELFQSYAVGRSRRNITQLMDIRPDYANIEVDGTLERVDPSDVEVGSVIVVQPGEKVPVDGLVIEGTSSLDTSALTGESLPREVGQGDELISGCINISGVLRVRTTKEFGESTVSKILDLVENASSRKSRSEDFISKFARPGHQLPLCTGHIHTAFVLRRHRWRQQGRGPCQGFELPRDALEDEDRRLRQDRNADARGLRGQRNPSQHAGGRKDTGACRPCRGGILPPDSQEHRACLWRRRGPQQGGGHP